MLELASWLAGIDGEISVPMDKDSKRSELALRLAGVDGTLCTRSWSWRFCWLVLNLRSRSPWTMKKERGVLGPALVPQWTMEQGSKSCDAQLEGNRVMGDMVNILVQGLDGRHLSMRVARGTRVSVLCMDLVSKVGIPQDVFFDSAGKSTAL